MMIKISPWEFWKAQWSVRNEFKTLRIAIIMVSTIVATIWISSDTVIQPKPLLLMYGGLYLLMVSAYFAFKFVCMTFAAIGIYACLKSEKGIKDNMLPSDHKLAILYLDSLTWRK